MGSILSVVPGPDRSRVRARAYRLWWAATGVRGVTPRLRWRACAQVAAIAPDLDADRLELLLRCTLWAYRLDDRAESLRHDGAALSRFRCQVAAAAAGEVAGRRDPFLADLRGILADLSRYDSTGEATAWYRGAVRDAADAEADQRQLERAVAAGAGPPTVEQYLTVAARNMNYRSFAYALLALGAEPWTSAKLHRIDEPLWHACCAVRLANDMRGREQDHACGTLNVLELRTGSGIRVTPGYLWAQVDRLVAAHEHALAALTGAGVISDGSARALTRSLAQSVRLYRGTDLR